MTTLLLYTDLYRDEGKRNLAYKDSLGNWTIGVGHKDHHIHEGVYWSDAIIDQVLHQDVLQCWTCLDTSPLFGFWWRGLNDFRQDALANMCFNMGVKTLSTFDTFTSLLRHGQYAQAAEDQVHTLWATQVGKRAVRIADQIRTGLHQQ